MRLLLRAARLALGAAVLTTAATPACFNAGQGTPPPADSFYYPTGLAVSTGGNVLYAINSDFDLQWNGGTLQSYDLFQIRQDAASLVQANLSGSSTPPPGIPFLQPWVSNACPNYPPPPTNDGSGIGVPLGQACAPPVDSTQYVRDSAIVGAFATDLQLSKYPYTQDGPPLAGTRLFSPISGNATITWADVAADSSSSFPSPSDTASTFAPFALDCGTRVDGRCADDHQTGDNAVSLGNTRNVTMPGEPFGMAQSADATALVVTSETSTQSSLLTSGINNPVYGVPTMQFVVGNMPNGGVGVTAVPHDPLASLRPCELVGDEQPCVRQAFLQTSRQSAELDLLRYYDDDGSCITAPCTQSTGAVYRPFLEKERAYSITSNSSGTDFRGSAIDISNRLQCEAQPGLTAAEMTACAELPARLYIASRTPPSLVVGTVGAVLNDNTYDPDSVSIIGNVPLTVGPSKVFVAPILVRESDGYRHYQMMVFVVCFDSNAIYVYNPQDLDSPSTAVPAAPPIPTGTGPYAMAFDPFDVTAAATGAVVNADPRQPASLDLPPYRFAYIASFTHSYVQVLDLDSTSPVTFESVVFTLGKPVPPKGQ